MKLLLILLFFFQELNKRQSQLESAHTMLMRHHEQTHELESKQQRSVHHIREDHLNRQHSTELSNQEEYMKRAQRELKKKHALEIKQQPKSLKQKELVCNYRSHRAALKNSEITNVCEKFARLPPEANQFHFHTNCTFFGF